MCIRDSHPSGHFNSQGIRLKKTSIISTNKNCNGATLNVDNVPSAGVMTSRLIGAGKGSCKHSDLEGASFQVEIQYRGKLVPKTIYITATGELNRGKYTFPAYKFSLSKEPDKESLCNFSFSQKLYTGTDPVSY